jgi:hypothetical protein
VTSATRFLHSRVPLVGPTQVLVYQLSEIFLSNRLPPKNRSSSQAPRPYSTPTKTSTFGPELPLAMETLANASSFASPLADADLNFQAFQSNGFLARTWAQFNVWTVLLSLLVLCATYDQCEPSKLYTRLLSLQQLTLLQSVISFGNMALLVRPGKCPLWAPSWNRSNQISRNTRPNGKVLI